MFFASFFQCYFSILVMVALSSKSKSRANKSNICGFKDKVKEIDKCDVSSTSLVFFLKNVKHLFVIVLSTK